MARHHAAILTSIWGDPDWTGLTGGAQRLYMLLLSQPRMSLVGALDIMPHRWAALASDTTLATVTADLLELEAARFVALDHDTQEVVIRTFVRHDIPIGRFNRNLAAGLWTSWGQVLSPALRKVVLEELPEFVWDKSGDTIPAQAKCMRRSPRLEPEPFPRSEPDEGSRLEPEMPPRFEPQGRSPFEPPSPFSLPPSTPSSSSSEPRASGAPGFPQDDDKRIHQARIETALAILVDRDLTARQTAPNVPPLGNVESWTRKAIAQRRRRHSAELTNLAAQRPDASPAELAEAVDPLPLEAPPAMDAYAEQRAAARRRAEAGTAQVREVLHEPAPPPEVLANGARAAREALQQPRPERT